LADEQGNKGSLGLGLLIAGGVNLAALIVAGVTMMIGIGMVLLMGFGLLQFLWLRPFYLSYKRKGEGDTCKGILLGSGLTLLLSAACWGSFNLNKMMH
jgi:hypothetical protein